MSLKHKSVKLSFNYTLKLKSNPVLCLCLTQTLKNFSKIHSSFCITY